MDPHQRAVPERSLLGASEVTRRSLIDLHAEIRAHERRYNDSVADRQAQHAKLLEMPRRPVGPSDPGITPDDLAQRIAEMKRAGDGENGERLPPRPALAILMGRKEAKNLRRMDGAEKHLEYWLGGEETFAGVPIIIRKGAGAVRVFNEIEELDAAIRELPQPMRPGLRRR